MLKKTLFVLLATSFSASLYHHQNIGLQGLFIPSNSVVFFLLTAFFMVGGLRLLRFGEFNIPPRASAPVLLAPLGMVLAGLLVGVDSPVSWFLTIGFLCSAPIFILSLLQLYKSPKSLQPLLYTLLVILGVHALIGVLQLLAPGWGYGWIPVPEDPAPAGMYMQANVQASMMATAVILGLYLLIQTDVKSISLWRVAIIAAVLLLALFNVFSAGSRVGLLGVLVGMVVLFATNFSRLKACKGNLVFVLFACVLGAVWGGVSGNGVINAYSKIERLAVDGTDVRPHIYKISWEAFKDAPLAGHGIGSFEAVFQAQAASYQDERGGKNLIGHFSYTHPHNELLLWAVEGGGVALCVILFAAIAVLCQLYKLGWEQGGAIAALLVPITLHTQVELPFYISAFHWLIWLLFVSMAFVGVQKTIKFDLSSRLVKMMVFAFISIFIPIQAFLLHSFYVSNAIGFALNNSKYNLRFLASLGRNPYFTDYVNAHVMRTLYFHDKSTGGVEGAKAFIGWAEEYLRKHPRPVLHRDLIDAYVYTGSLEKASKEAKYALYLYTNDPVIQNYLSEGVLKNRVGQ